MLKVYCMSGSILQETILQVEKVGPGGHPVAHQPQVNNKTTPNQGLKKLFFILLQSQIYIASRPFG